MATVKPRLAELPEELISNISIKLGPDDIFAFRLTCRSLEERSFHEFAAEHFSQKCFMPTTESLKVLSHIAESERLRGYLHQIYVVPALFSDRTLNCCNGKGCAWKPTIRNREAMRDYIEDQKTLSKSGRDLEIFTRAFKRLPNLHDLCLADSWSSMPAGIDTRGGARSMRKTNSNPIVLPAHPEDKEYYKWKNHVWRTLITAIANSGIDTLTRFSTDLDGIKNPLTLASLSFTPKLLAGLAKSFQSLKTLNLQIRSIEPGRSTEDHDGVNTVRGADTMQRLAGIMLSIERLHLRFSYSASSSVLCQNFTASMELSKLTFLKLDSIYLDAQSLGITLCKATAIEDLQLLYINLTEGIWPTVLKVIQKLDKLQHLHLMYLYESTQRVSFLEPIEHEAIGPHAPGGPQVFPPGFNDFVDFGDDEEDDEDYEPDDEDDDDDDDDDDYSDEDEEDDSLPDLEPLPGAYARPSVESDEESDTDTDDSMPSLEPQSGAGPHTGMAIVESDANQTHAPQHHTHGTTNANHNTHTTANHSPPALNPFGHDEERGRYICLSSPQEIRVQLPTFIKEYNVLDDNDDFMNGIPPPPPGNTGGAGMPPPGNMNALINSLGAAFGMGPPANVTGNVQAGAATFIGPPLPPGLGPVPHGGPSPNVVFGGAYTVPVGGHPGPPPNANVATGGNGNAGGHDQGQATAGASQDPGEDDSEADTDEFF